MGRDRQLPILFNLISTGVDKAIWGNNWDGVNYWISSIYKHLQVTTNPVGANYNKRTADSQTIHPIGRKSGVGWV